MSCLTRNQSLEEISMPLVQTIDAYFMRDNQCLKILYMPQIKKIGDFFLLKNKDFMNEVISRGGLEEALRKYSTRASQMDITPERALKSALLQGTTTEHVNQANKIEQEQTKENINKEDSIDDK